MGQSHLNMSNSGGLRTKGCFLPGRNTHDKRECLVKELRWRSTRSLGQGSSAGRQRRGRKRKKKKQTTTALLMKKAGEIVSNMQQPPPHSGYAPPSGSPVHAHPQNHPHHTDLYSPDPSTFRPRPPPRTVPPQGLPTSPCGPTIRSSL
jgi:hypothetical protein